MAATFEKLNLKDQQQILAINAPPSFEIEIESLREVTVLRSVKDANHFDFTLAFVTRQQDVDRMAKAIVKKVPGDAIVWFAYPKGTSKKYKSEINRDHGWQALGATGFEPVRGIAIDEDWSALRFRRVEFIKNMTRSRRLSSKK